MALGSILERFWAQVGGQNGAKLAPKSEKWGSQDDVKKSKAKRSCGFMRVHPVRGGVGPYKPYIPEPPGGSQWAIGHSTSCHKGTVADIYIYIYIYICIYMYMYI